MSSRSVPLFLCRLQIARYRQHMMTPPADCPSALGSLAPALTSTGTTLPKDTTPALLEAGCRYTTHAQTRDLFDRHYSRYTPHTLRDDAMLPRVSVADHMSWMKRSRIEEILSAQQRRALFILLQPVPGSPAVARRTSRMLHGCWAGLQVQLVAPNDAEDPPVSLEPVPHLLRGCGKYGRYQP